LELHINKNCRKGWDSHQLRAVKYHTQNSTGDKASKPAVQPVVNKELGRGETHRFRGDLFQQHKPESYTTPQENTIPGIHSRAKCISDQRLQLKL
jgi:hypothetical protein